MSNIPNPKFFMMGFMKENSIDGKLLFSMISPNWLSSEVIVTPLLYYIGVFALPTKAILSLDRPKGKYESSKPRVVLYEFGEFCKDLKKGIPFAVEMLFAKASKHVYESPYWKSLGLKKDRFRLISEKTVESYRIFHNSSYAQLNSNTENKGYSVTLFDSFIRAYELEAVLGGRGPVPARKGIMTRLLSDQKKESSTKKKEYIAILKRMRKDIRKLQTKAVGKGKVIDQKSLEKKDFRLGYEILNSCLLKVRQDHYLSSVRKKKKSEAVTKKKKEKVEEEKEEEEEEGEDDESKKSLEEELDSLCSGSASSFLCDSSSEDEEDDDSDSDSDKDEPFAPFCPIPQKKEFDKSLIVKRGKIISQGSYGRIYTAYIELGEAKPIEVALKIVPLRSTRVQKVMENEVEIMKGLKHPYLLNCFGSFIENNAIVIVTEFCEDGDLFSLKDKLPIEEKLMLIQQICVGMAHLHKKGIAHRDLKNQNILHKKKNPGSKYGGTAKICDFGTSTNVGDAGNTFVGTVEYLATEVVNSKYRPRARNPKDVAEFAKLIDIYSFGVVAWELLSGKQPFLDLRIRCRNNQFDMIREIHKKHLRPNLRDIDSTDVKKGHNRFKNEIRGLKKLIKKCWCRNPLDRPKSFDAIIKEDLKMIFKKKKDGVYYLGGDAIASI